MPEYKKEIRISKRHCHLLAERRRESAYLDGLI